MNDELVGLADLVDRLSIVNIKLAKVKDEQSALIGPSKAACEMNYEMVCKLGNLTRQDIQLCIERSRLKCAIDALYGRISGEVKLYG